MKQTSCRKARFASVLKHWRVTLLMLFLLLVLVLVTACGGAPSTSTANTVSTTPTAGATTTPTKGRGISKTVLAQSLETLGPYMPAFKQQLAQGLHLTVTQLTQKTQAGQTLTAVASAQGLSSTQLSTLIASALSTSLAPLVQSGKTTQQQIKRLTRILQRDPNLLDTVLAQ